MMKLGLQTGFSLMELIGVMAVMAILAGTLAPNIADGLNQAYSDAEKASMQVLSDGLRRYVLEQKRIPRANINQWRPAIASVVSVPDDQVAFNDKGFRRRLVFDPRFLTTVDSNFPGIVQNQGLAAPPVSPRAMLISDLNRNVPAVANNTATFTSIWNQTGTPPIVESDDVIIERIHFGDLFHRVILSNQNAAQPYFRFETGTTVAVPPSVGGADGVITRYVLQNSQISLFQDPFPSGGLQHVMLVKEDYSNRYQTDGFNWSWVQP